MTEYFQEGFILMQFDITYVYPVVCDKGQYRTEGNHCESCVKGTYQPLRGSKTCIPCGVRQTTPNTGSISKNQCQTGLVDECVTGSGQCHPQAICLDADDGYTCTCKSGFTGNGFNCTGGVFLLSWFFI